MEAKAQQIPIQNTSSLEKYVNWCKQQMLPWWLVNAIDQQKGGFFEQFDLQGQPDRNCTRRVRVASRQIYSFSHAHTLGWIEAKTPILNGIDWLIDRTWGKNAEPGFLAKVDDDGRCVDPTRDLYDHAFHILGFSTAYMASKDPQVLSAAKLTLDFVEEALGAKNGGWHETLNHDQPRRQNPHMHMFEALLALYEASGDNAYLKRADDVGLLLFERFIDSKTNLLFEFFDADWKPQTPAQIEPGHMSEWTWLLHRRNTLNQKQLDCSPAAEFLINAEKLGQQENGLLINTCDIDGNYLHDKSRLWVQTEWLKALMITPNTNQQQDHLTQLIFTHYLNNEHSNLWMDAVNTKTMPLCQHVPASIVYHLISAAAEAENTLNNSN